MLNRADCRCELSKLDRLLEPELWELILSLGAVLILSMLCRTVFSNSFFFADGKYSAKWVEMSSEGGRWPKKLYIFLPLFARNEPDAGDRWLLPFGVIGCSTSATPNPDMTLTVLARFIFLAALDLEGASGSSPGGDVIPSLGPAKWGDVGDIGGGGVSPKKSSMFLRFWSLRVRRNVRPCLREGSSGDA